jgi:putative transposase
LLALAHEQPRYGYRRLCVLVNDGGAVVNHKRVQRVYRAAGLQVKRIRRRRLSRSAVPRVTLTAANQEWALDFASDVTASGRRIRVLGVIDAFTRECLALETDTSFPSRRLTRVLETVIAQRGKPASLRSDNGPEMTSRHYLAWCIEQKIAAVHIQPGRPMQNGHVESFNGRLRDECLNTSWFANLWDGALENHPLAMALQHAETALAVGLSDSRSVCVQLGDHSFAVTRIESRSSSAASRPSPAGACGGLDPAPLPRPRSPLRRRRRFVKLYN